LEDAERFLRESAAAGTSYAAMGLAELLLLTGRQAEAEEYLRGAHVDGNLDATVMLAHLLANTDRFAEAEMLLRQAQVDGNCHVALALAQLLLRMGRADEAEEVLRRAARQGDSRATTAFARFLLNHGRTEEAEHLLRNASAGGDRRAASALARLSAVDDLDEVDELVRHNAYTQVHFACHSAAADLLDAGRTDAALRVLGGAADNDIHPLLLNACESGRNDALTLFLQVVALHGTRYQTVLTRPDDVPESWTSLRNWLAHQHQSHEPGLWATRLPYRSAPIQGATHPVTIGYAASRIPSHVDDDRLMELERRLAKLEAQARATAPDSTRPGGD
jgi:thioredoxin-like negative regulator of GroEL